MSTSRSQPPGWLGKSWFDAVSSVPFLVLSFLTYVRLGFYIFYIFQSMAILNSKAKNVISRMLNSCQGGGLMSRRPNLRIISLIMSMNRRFVYLFIFI